LVRSFRQPDRKFEGTSFIFVTFVDPVFGSFVLVLSPSAVVSERLQRACLARLGLRPGTFLGISSIRFDLCLVGHAAISGKRLHGGDHKKRRVKNGTGGHHESNESHESETGRKETRVRHSSPFRFVQFVRFLVTVPRKRPELPGGRGRPVDGRLPGP
jgi:hypothetical protein